MSAKKRLLRDLKELESNPLVGINARPFDDNIMKWYGIIVCPEGTPYANIPIKFILEFSDEYPFKAPKAFFETHLPTVGMFSTEIVEGRQSICMSILGNYEHVHSDWKNIPDGWCPSYTVSKLLLAMQGVMLTDNVTKNEKAINEFKNRALNFKCNVTGHDGSNKKTWFPPVFTSQKELDEYKENNFML